VLQEPGWCEAGVRSLPRGDACSRLLVPLPPAPRLTPAPAAPSTAPAVRGSTSPPASAPAPLRRTAVQPQAPCIYDICEIYRWAGGLVALEELRQRGSSEAPASAGRAGAPAGAGRERPPRRTAHTASWKPLGPHLGSHPHSPDQQHVARAAQQLPPHPDMMLGHVFGIEQRLVAGRQQLLLHHPTPVGVLRAQHLASGGRGGEGEGVQQSRRQGEQQAAARPARPVAGSWCALPASPLLLPPRPSCHLPGLCRGAPRR
jgi:hypothetical protein